MNQNLECCGVECQTAKELKHVRSCWVCFLLLGVLLVLCGTAAIVVPPFTIAYSLATVIVLGVLLMVAGIVTIVSAFWIGKWSGMLLHLLAGILYLVMGFMITERPGAAAIVMTLFIAATFIVLGAFRIVSSLAIRFPQWGWVLLNGIITLLLGVIIYRHFPESALWVIGLLVGIELLFNGWSWIMLSLAISRIPKELPAA
jgi:uncharacterized membrane protein HdeD (DUF308 family)